MAARDGICRRAAGCQGNNHDPSSQRLQTLCGFESDFDSENDFLYRQKGQLKLDNTILEEFLPLLVTSVLFDGRLVSGLFVGPASCFSGVRFESAVLRPRPGAGMIKVN